MRELERLRPLMKELPADIRAAQVQAEKREILSSGVVGFVVKGIVIFGIANIIFLGATFLMPEFGQTKELILKIIKRNF